MFSVLPTSAAALRKEDMDALVTTATATAKALLPYLHSSSDDGAADAAVTFRKVVSCRAHYTALLCSDGRLLLLLLQSATASSNAGPTVSVLESGGAPVVDVAAGAHHIVYCTAPGAVFSCGYDNTYGQLGDGSMWSAVAGDHIPAEAASAERNAVPSMSEPRRVGRFGAAAKATSAAAAPPVGKRRTDAGWCEAMLEGVKGTATMSAPANVSADASASPYTPAASALKRRATQPLDDGIVHVACGAYHTLLLTTSGRCVYACGRGDRGALGVAQSPLVQPSFRVIPLLVGLVVRQIAAGDAHSFVLLQCGLVYAFGDNVGGQLGLGDTMQVMQPTLVPLPGQYPASAASPGATMTRTRTGRPPPDAKACSSLRADYWTMESAYYPLRVDRLRTDDSLPGQRAAAAASGSVVAAVRRVHCCSTWTLLETEDPALWLSCGAVLSRGVSIRSNSATAAKSGTPPVRLDGCGVLGRRVLGSKSDAFYFTPVCWGTGLQSLVTAAAAMDAQGTANGQPHCLPSWYSPTEAGDPGSAFLADAATAEVDETPFTVTRASASHGRSGGAEGRHRVSETTPSLCHTKKTMKLKDTNEAASGAVQVCIYAASLLLHVPAAAGASSSVLAQGGTAAAAFAVELDGVERSAPHLVYGVALHEKKEEGMSRLKGSNSGLVDAVDELEAPVGSSGAVVLQLHSARGVMVPLRDFALVL